METILTIKWSAEDVTALAESRGIDPQAALNEVVDSISQVEDRSIEAGWTAIEFILDDIKED